MGNNKQRNFLTQNIERLGENWVQLVRPEDIQNNTRRLVKEMVLGKINYEQVGNYFKDPKFLENFLIGLNNELEINTLYYNAVTFYQSYYPQYQNIGVQVQHLYCLNTVYVTIINRLQCVQAEDNIGYLADLSSILFQYRNHLV